MKRTVQKKTKSGKFWAGAALGRFTAFVIKPFIFVLNRAILATDLMVLYNIGVQ